MTDRKVLENGGVVMGASSPSAPTALAPLRGQAPAGLEQSRSSTGAGFTPGPWALCDSTLDSGPGDEGPIWDVHIPHKQTIANVREYRDARLIAAAPELYDALHDAAIALNAVLDVPEDETRRPHARYFLERARAALAKASDSDGSGEAGETALAGSTEGDSAGPKDIAHPSSPSDHPGERA